MPIALFAVVIVAMLLNKRVEGKLLSTVEEKEFKTRDIILLVVFMAIIISAIAYASMINPGALFQNILLIFFLSSYTMLLFTVLIRVLESHKNKGTAAFSWVRRCKL